MSIYDKKYQIFVSSTYIDLIKAREEVIKVILSLYQIPIGMEMFSADNNEQWSVIKSTIENSDYYILILGHRYGSLTKEEISYTEKEFDYAKEKNIPIISFVRNRDIPTKPSERDKENFKIKKLAKFYQKVLDNSICDFWDNENELGQKVAISLTKIFFKTPRIGWVRSDKTNSLETTEELTTLIQENRYLRDELESLKSFKNTELPKISTKINGKKTLEIKFKEISTIEFKKIENSIPKHLMEYLSKNDIEKYNNAIDEKQLEIKNYISLFRIYKIKKENNEQIWFEIKNSGKSKANDVYIDFIFPKEVLVFEKIDLEELKEPEKPILPINPVNYALKKHNETKYDDLTSLSKNFDGYSLFAPSISPIMSSRLLRNISNVNRNIWVDQYKNQVTIKLSKLSHTRTITIEDDILIAPLKKGKFKIEVSIICDEFKEPELLSIPIVVK